MSPVSQFIVLEKQGFFFFNGEVQTYTKLEYNELPCIHHPPQQWSIHGQSFFTCASTPLPLHIILKPIQDIKSFHLEIFQYVFLKEDPLLI